MSNNNPSININQAGIVNTGDLTVQGDQIGIQDNFQTQQTFEMLLTDFQSFVASLATQHPDINTSESAEKVITVEAQRQSSIRLKNFLDLKRLWNGGKKATLKVGEHFAENNVWGKGAIAFLEGVSEDIS